MMESGRIVRRTIEGQVHTSYIDREIAGAGDKQAEYQVEMYAKDFTYRLSGVPNGKYRLTLGFSENWLQGDGVRIFDIDVNGSTVFSGIDLYKETGGKYKALDKTAEIEVTDGVVTVRFQASVDSGKLSYIRIENDDFLLEDSAARITGQSESKTPPGNSFEAVIPRFGSRYCYVLRPQARNAYYSPVGRYWDRAGSVLLAARSGETFRALPFTDGMPLFSDVDQQITMTSLSYEASDPKLPFKVSYKFTSPFYPQDEKICFAPFFYLDVIVENTSVAEESGELYMGFPHVTGDVIEEAEFAGKKALVVTGTFEGRTTKEARLVGESVEHVVDLDQRVQHWAWTPDKRDEQGRQVAGVQNELAFSGAIMNFSLAPGEKRTERFSMAAWTDANILNVVGEDYKFKYTQLFSGIEDVISFAFAEEPEIRRKTALYDSTVLDSTVSDDAKNFIAFSYLSFAMNAFYCISEKGEDWFSVWEGCCRYHSTVDVEYHYGLWYFEYWPRLLSMLLDAWPKFRKPGVISHDIGWNERVYGMTYGHDMEVEENTNYLLMSFDYWKRTGDFGPIKRNWDVIKEIVQYCIDADTTGNGFPNEGSANTIDMGSPAIQYSKEQTYLAVRVLTAFECVTAIAREIGDESQVPAMREQINRINKSLSEKAWLGDHYAVCLDYDKTKLRDAWTGEQLEGEYLEGWDAYSIYANNGLLYPFRSGLPVDIDMARIKEDLVNATEKTMTKYGSTHTTIEKNLWVSQNLWRDMIAAYLGIDYIDNISRYWAFELYANREKLGCFADVHEEGKVSLDYYPRGITAIGIMGALAGMQVDATKREITFAPIRLPLTIPVMFAADWKQGRIPWAVFTEEDGNAELSIENQETLSGWQVKLR